MTAKLRFERPALAAQMAESVSGRHKWNSDADGLFLAAPRRTGKSTFLKADLVPALEALGAEVIYLDLWTNEETDPVELLYAEISRALLANAGFVTRMAERAKLSRVLLGAGGSALEFNPSLIGKSAGSSLMAALRELCEATGKPVALILDEAQHLTVSPKGDSVLKALKAARDTLNRPDDIRLMLVMSGSDRDKLGRLTNSKAAAFYGSKVKPLPMLDGYYVGWLGGLLAQSNPKLGSIDIGLLAEAFDVLGQRPRMMDEAIGSALNPVTRGEMEFEQAVLDQAQAIVRAEYAQYADRFAARTATQQAVLVVLMENGDSFNAYGAATLKAVSDLVGKGTTTTSVQAALKALRELNPPMVWKSNRGEYALDDLGMVDWYEQQKMDIQVRSIR